MNQVTGRINPVWEEYRFEIGWRAALGLASDSLFPEVRLWHLKHTLRRRFYSRGSGSGRW